VYTSIRPFNIFAIILPGIGFSALTVLVGRQEELSAVQPNVKLEMWATAQRDGRPVEYMWRPLLNAAKFG